ncbi:MAG: ATP-binding cassette domain-containing protein [Lactobacillaceae bacterium]|jgi:ABC-2 type transport system ATP-binding protein|nr:ATP-binding cassette domain-containing protein [Lactobacillaceae bacterium]
MLEVKNITKKFGNFIAVEDESFKIDDGKILGLIGQNGAGKSTTFKMILNFLKPDQGEIFWNGQKISDPTLDEIGFLPEERGIDVNLTAEQQILFFAELHGLKRKEVQGKIDDWFTRFDVRGKKTDKIKKFSKGNQQKIQIIATLIHNPKLLILDEPFSGLDPVNTSLFLNEIKIAAKNGASVIFSSHDMGNVSEISDDILMLIKGKAVLSGDINQVRSSFGRTQLYLESPISNDELRKINGVLDISNHELGRIIRLADEKTGEKIFKLVTKNGFIPAFSLQPPTLDEIFRIKIDNFTNE